MALGAVLVDRARIVSKQDTGVKVEGRTRFTPVAGEWFKARLFLPASSERRDPEGGRRKVIKTPQLMFKARDAAGDPILLRADQRIEVDSAELGRALWRVEGEPEPLRKKRTVIGWLANVARAEEREFEELLT